MNEESTVIQIVDAQAKHGYSEKTKKDWSMSRVGLKNGESCFIFNPIEIGDVVEKVKNGEYENWQKKRIDPKHDELVKLLKQVNVKLDKLLGVDEEISNTKANNEPLPDEPPDYGDEDY